MSRPITLTAILIISLMASSCGRESFTGQPPMMQPPADGPMMGDALTRNTLIASGFAMTQIEPDQANLTTFVRVIGEDLAAATAEVTTKVNEILRIARAGGLPATDIRTGRLVITGIYDEAARVPVSQGFVVSKEVQVTFNDLGKVDSVVASLLSYKGLSNWSFSYRNTKVKEQQAKMLEEAIKRAGEKAIVMAGVSGQVPGPPISITERPSGQMSPPDLKNRGDGNAFMQMAGKDVDLIASAPPAPGLILVEAKVDVVFLLAD
ncbi:MAG: SIMPL domain-containing protein [Pseudomonadota bacterium]